MSVNLYNREHYIDPTAYAALDHIEQEARASGFRPLVYICSPFSGDTELNAQRARGYCRFAVSKNCIPIAPHLLFPQFMDDSDPEQRSLGLFFGLVLQSKCKEVWVFGANISHGMALEIAKAKERRITTRYFNHRCSEMRVKKWR